MNTNTQTHTDWIWSFTFDPPKVVTIIFWVAIVLAVVLAVLARKRKIP
jgi:hypothetical protein